MGDFYDPISGVYIKSTETWEDLSVKCGTKRRRYDNDISKKIKKEDELARITKLEIQIEEFEQLNISNNLKYEIFEFREKLIYYKKCLIR